MLALIFPGQGSQRPGMGARWRRHPSWQVVQEVSDATGRDVAALLLDADADTLKATRNAQLAAFALSLVALDGARRAGAGDGAPGAVAGHSLGEYTALVAGGHLTAVEGARLVAARGDAMQHASETHPGTMAAVIGLPPETVAEACSGVDGAWMANDNAPGQVVVAGTHRGVDDAGQAARKLGAKRVIPLAVGGAFHTPLMGPAQVALDAALGEARFTASPVTVVANVDASPHQTDFVPLLSAQLCSPVRWRQSLLAMVAMGVDGFLELGPGTEMTGMVKRTVPDAARANVATPEDTASLDGFLQQGAQS
jgi:[acyl-carrier-protein] S-malonyltransferase